VHKFAAQYGAEMRWHFILPMIMRGLPVPPAKSRYITLDVKREASLFGMPYGTIVDPAGEGIHHAIAVFHRAIAMGRGAEFAESGLQAAFAGGIDLATDSGMSRAARGAGLSDNDVKGSLADQSWRAIAEEKLISLFDVGLWGAPTFRVNGMPAHWGQDRISALEEDLKALG
jgi:2-hydroxychromene-2-carboxylate isomerase